VCIARQRKLVWLSRAAASHDAAKIIGIVAIQHGIWIRGETEKEVGERRSTSATLCTVMLRCALLRASKHDGPDASTSVLGRLSFEAREDAGASG
jgi:hypothetical protein